MQTPIPLPRLTLSIAALAVLFVGAHAASAQDFMSQTFIKPGEETLSLDLGGILNQFHTSLQLNGQGQNGSNVNLENGGLKKNLASFDVGGTWRFLSRNRIDLNYFSAKRTGSHQYEGEITIDGTTFPVGATVSTQAKDSFLAADYRYSFVKTDAVEVAGLLGFYGGQFKFNVDATGNEGVNPKTLNTTASTTVPLPLIGATLDWYINPRWRISGNVEGVKAKISNVDGRVIVAGVSTDYMLVRNFGVGLRYMYSDVSVDVTKNSFNGNLNWKMNSALLYGRFMF